MEKFETENTPQVEALKPKLQEPKKEKAKKRTTRVPIWKRPLEKGTKRVAKKSDEKKPVTKVRTKKRVPKKTTDLTSKNFTKLFGEAPRRRVPKKRVKKEASAGIKKPRVPKKKKTRNPLKKLGESPKEENRRIPVARKVRPIIPVK